ncbi:MAG: family 10 glycosylhydrolase, partial [Clostridia bacterium]|nr:family 10 glycosylhydrolase [Clostridia bacterium]
EESLKIETDEIVKTVRDTGLNAVFLQVRPCADSLYPSKVFPTSVYLTGEQGAQISFDPLEYFVSACRRNGIKIFAWINPYRITVKKFPDKESAHDSLSKDHPAYLAPQTAIFAGDGRLYFDPGSPDARKIILDGVREIVENYAVDGIQYDDYFYPHTDFDDKESFNKYGGGSDLSDFRRESVNTLVRETHDICKARGVEFGVAPSGIWANSESLNGGSDTVGDQSYFSSYADSRAWVKNRWVDHIAPQLYWAQGGKEGEFETLLSWWSDLADKNGVALYIGLAAYRSAEKDAAPPWKDGEEIVSQLDMISMKGRTDGHVFFRYGSVKGSALIRRLPERYGKRTYAGVNAPVFVTGESFEINSQAFSVIGFKKTVSCASRRGEKVLVLNGETAVTAVRRGNELKAVTKQGKTPLLFIGDRFGCLSLRIERTKPVKQEPPAKVTDVNVKEEDGYTVFELYTGRPCAARSEIKDGI